MNVKLVIFDLDGTLLNTVEDLANATNYALQKNGFPTHQVEEYNYLCGRGIYNLFADALPKEYSNQGNIELIRNDFIDYYTQHNTDYTKPYLGIKELLVALDNKGIKLAIATNKYQMGAEQLCESLFPDINFIKIIGQRSGYPIKPDPQIIYEIMSEVSDISKAEIVYCGDSDVDMQTGINAGVKTIGVTWGFRPKEELEKYNPWKIVNTPKDMLDILL